MSDNPRHQPIQILMAEDNPDDVELAHEALIDAKLDLKLNVVEDGEAALAYLRKEEPYAQAIRPDLILLDLNMPRLGGREVLAAIKQDADLSTIPVVVFTSSLLNKDITESYELHANCYITKPVDFDQFVRIVQSIEDFWFTVVKLPKV